VVWAGSNDISKNNTNEALSHLSNFVGNNLHVNFVVLTPPHRHDLIPSSCVNDEVDNFNRRLIARLVHFKSVKILATNLARKYFTRHGMHLNTSGKERVARCTAMVIKSFCKNKTRPPSNLGCKDGITVTTSNDTEPQLALRNPEIVSSPQCDKSPDQSSVSTVDMMNVSTTSKDPDSTEPPINPPPNSELNKRNEGMPIINEERHTDLIDLHTQDDPNSKLLSPDPTPNENAASSTMKILKEEAICANKTPDNVESVAPLTSQHEDPRKSNRTKKAPQTRRDDFLWT
jgi:hypothetical protein